MKRKLIIAGMAALLVLTAVSSAFAYLRASQKPSANIITTGKVSALLAVDAIDKQPTKIEVTNNGTVEEYVRIKVSVTETDDQGQKKSVDPASYLNIDEEKWIKHTDGMYYLKAPLAPNTMVNLLKQAPSSEQNAVDVEMIIQAQAVQRRNNGDNPTAAVGWPAFPIPVA